MTAVICTKYRFPDVLQLKEIEKLIPMDNEMQIKVHATTCHARDVVIVESKLKYLGRNNC